jgi:hypothetical protein
MYRSIPLGSRTSLPASFTSFASCSAAIVGGEGGGDWRGNESFAEVGVEEVVEVEEVEVATAWRKVGWEVEEARRRRRR